MGNNYGGESVGSGGTNIMCFLPFDQIECIPDIDGDLGGDECRGDSDRTILGGRVLCWGVVVGIGGRVGVYGDFSNGGSKTEIRGVNRILPSGRW